jgi:hypothetical protein
MYIIRSWGSSVSIVYWLQTGRPDDQSSIPAEAKDFSSSLYVQTSSEAHPAFYPVGTEVLSPGVKRGRGVTLITHSDLVPRSRMSRSCASSPPCHLHDGSGTGFFLSIYKSCCKCCPCTCTHSLFHLHTLKFTQGSSSWGSSRFLFMFFFDSYSV